MMSIDVSNHYTGSAGQEYFEWQNSRGEFGGLLGARYFQAHIPAEAKVLDFGCGGGWMLKHLKCAERFGVEPNVAAHPTARQNGLKVAADVSSFDGLFDRIVSNHCLEHVPYPIEALRSLHERLAPDGKLVLLVPIDDWRAQRAIEKPDVNHHLHTWTPLLLKNTLEEAGFKVQSVKVITHAWPPRAQQLYKILPNSLFDAIGSAFSALRMRRQILAVAGG